PTSLPIFIFLLLFFFNDPTTSKLYTLSLYDALPICFVFKIQANMDPKHRDRIAFLRITSGRYEKGMRLYQVRTRREMQVMNALRSEEHTSELQSRENLVCRLLLEKKKHEEK